MGYKSDAQRKAVHASKAEAAAKMYGSPMKMDHGSPMKKESPYMMYGKESAAMMSESPLAKYGCSKKYKKSGIKMKGEDKLEATILHDTDKGEQTKYKGKMVTIKGNTVTKGGNVVGYVGKKDKKIKEI